MPFGAGILAEPGDQPMSPEDGVDDPDEEMFDGSGHFPVLDAAKHWQQTFFDFLASVD